MKKVSTAVAQRVDKCLTPPTLLETRFYANKTLCGSANPRAFIVGVVYGDGKSAPLPSELTPTGKGEEWQEESTKKDYSAALDLSAASFLV
jgi:hypothetical protein